MHLVCTLLINGVRRFNQFRLSVRVVPVEKRASLNLSTDSTQAQYQSRFLNRVPASPVLLWVPARSHKAVAA